MGLSPEQARKLLEANSILLVKKVVKEKKPLSSQEIALLQAASRLPAEDKVWAKTQVELADVLGVERKTIQRWLKIDGNPGARSNGSYAVAEWRTWRVSRRGGEDDTPDQTKARAEQLLLQNERLRYKIGREKGSLIPKQVAQKVFGKLLLDAKGRCFSSVSRFVTLARIAKNNDEAHEEIRKEMIAIWKALEEAAWQK